MADLGGIAIPLHGLTDADVRLVKKVIRESGTLRSSKPGTRRTRHLGGEGESGGGSKRTAGTASGLALCVSSIDAAIIPDLTGLAVADWEYEPGQEGPSAERGSLFGEAGTEFERITDIDGVVLVDWAKAYDHADICTYFDAPYVNPKTKLAPIVEGFGALTFHIGVGLGGEGGEGAGGFQGGGGGGI